MREILISSKYTERHAALLEDGKLLEYRFVRPSEAVSVGDVYWAAVERIDAKLGAAFVNIGSYGKAFIHMKDAPAAFTWTEGARLAVQITRAGTAVKLPLATANIEFANQLVVMIAGTHYVSVSKRLTTEERHIWIQRVKPLLSDSEAVILRSKVVETPFTEVEAALNELREKHAQLKMQAAARKKPGLLLKNEPDLTTIIAEWQQHYPNSTRIVADDKRITTATNYRTDLYTHYQLDALREELLRAEVVLASGVSLFIEKTEAMWIIDVNTHRYKSNRPKHEVMASVNISAAEEIIRQIRLRNMSGLIVIDFIGGMDEAGFQKVRNAMEVLAEKEYVTTQIADFSKTGLMQLTRRKKEPSLMEEWTIPCPVCKGSGHVPSALSLAYELERELGGYRSLRYARIYLTETVLDAFLELQSDSDLEIDWEIGDEAVPFYMIRRTES